MKLEIDKEELELILGHERHRRDENTQVLVSILELGQRAFKKRRLEIVSDDDAKTG